MFRYVTSSSWSKPGSYSKALSKGMYTTSWVWNLHADAHDFDSHSAASSLFERKVWSSNAAHLALVLLWLSGMHFHGAYFSNYIAWLIDPLHVLPSGHVVLDLLSQGNLNAASGGFHAGIPITSGLFHLWRSSGITSLTELRSLAVLLLLLSFTLFFSLFAFEVPRIAFSSSWI
jgi:photosystem I P700 chlorophyll a apoprotein A1